MTATWRQDQDANDTCTRNKNIRIRFIINATNDAIAKNFNLQYKAHDSAEWIDVPGMGPLTVSTVNARYLVDAKNKPVFLSGFHTWYDIMDGSGSDPPSAFDWDDYLSSLVSYGCNWTKAWVLETSRGWDDTSNQWFTPNIWKRTGPGNDNDGKLKFDLTQFNQTYFDRLRSRVIDCANRGIYVCVQLFQGWNLGLRDLGGTPWTYHPFELANNINSIDGDTNDDGKGMECHADTAVAAIINLQNAYVAKVIDTLNDLDNIIYEVSNEDGNYAIQWEYDLIDYIHTYEAGKPKQHLVMMSRVKDATNTPLDDSNADLHSYGAVDTGPLTDPFTPVGAPNMFDTDHCGGLIDTYAWMWRGLCRGNGGAWFAEDWAGQLYGTDIRNTPEYVLVRQNLGYIKTLFYLLKDPEGMTAQDALSTTGWCLAKDHATAAEYVVFQDDTGDFDLNLTTATGTLNIRWLKCADGTVSTATVSGGATRTLSPPWAGMVVAYVYH